MEKSTGRESESKRSNLVATQARRKSSVNAIALARARGETVDVVEDASLLSEADRRLAEMGYVQVCPRGMV